MNKFIYLILMILSPIMLMCQNSELIGTWYLSEFLPSDGNNEPYIISEFSPSISPTITFENESIFYGNGACNTFTGEYNIDENSLFIEVNQFLSTANICENEDLQDFEESYFSTIENNEFYVLSITQVANGYKLEMGTSFFGEAIFYSYPLAVEEVNNLKYDLTIYPNPTSDFLNIELPCESKKISILNFNRKLVKEIKSSNNQINISNLPSGSYILSVLCDNEEYFKHFIKK